MVGEDEVKRRVQKAVMAERAACEAICTELAAEAQVGSESADYTPSARKGLGMQAIGLRAAASAIRARSEKHR